MAEPVSVVPDHPTRDRLPRDAWTVIVVAIIGSFMAQLDATISNVSLSSLSDDLHAPLVTIQWVTSGYLLALALALPVNGWLVDRIGARAVYLGCFATFTVSSALCGAAWSAESLIGFRILQGISGGLLAPMAQLTVARIAGAQMARVSAIVTMPILLAPMLGPALAGTILQYASWRWLFLINVPIGLAVLVLAAIVLPSEPGAKRPRSLDLVGLVLLSPALVLFLFGADRVQLGYGWLCILAAALLLGGFVWRVRRLGSAALIDPALFRGGVFPVGVTVMFLANGAVFAGQMLVPIFLIRACALSPIAAGWMMLPLGLGMMSTYPLLGGMTDRFGIKRPAVVGAVLALLATTLLLVQADRGLMAAALAVALFLRGAGMSTIGIPSMSASYAAVPKGDLPMAATAMNIGQRIGGPTWTTLCAVVLGWSVSGMGVARVEPARFLPVFGVLCAIHALLLLATSRLPRRLPEMRDQ